jgi:hypothetical protein
MHHAVPIATKLGMILLKDLMRGIQLIESVQNRTANERELRGILDDLSTRQRRVIHGAKLI